MPTVADRRQGRNGRTYLIEGVEYPSVTNVLQVLAKPALVPWAAKVALESLRPAVATAESIRAEDAAALRQAVADLRQEAGHRRLSRVRLLEMSTALEGRVTDSLLPLITPEQWETARQAHRHAAAVAAGIGSAVHEWIEDVLAGRPEKPVGDDRERQARSAWTTWWLEQNLEVLATEQVVYSWDGYAGTLDAVARDDRGALVLLDWKTSSGIYPEMELQVAAYATAWEEMHPGEDVDRAVIVRIAKDNGTFETRTLPRKRLVRLHEVFLAVLEAWRWQAQEAR